MKTFRRTFRLLALWPTLIRAATIAPVPVELPTSSTVRGMAYVVIDDPGPSNRL